MSRVNIVELLLNIEVSEDIKADIITANINPTSYNEIHITQLGVYTFQYQVSISIHALT